MRAYPASPSNTKKKEETEKEKPVKDGIIPDRLHDRHAYRCHVSSMRALLASALFSGFLVCLLGRVSLRPNGFLIRRRMPIIRVHLLACFVSSVPIILINAISR